MSQRLVIAGRWLISFQPNCSRCPKGFGGRSKTTHFNFTPWKTHIQETTSSLGISQGIKSATAATGREALDWLAANKLDDGFMASPALDGDSLYLRTKSHVYRIGGMP